VESPIETIGLRGVTNQRKHNSQWIGNDWAVLILPRAASKGWQATLVPLVILGMTVSVRYDIRHTN